MNNNILTIESNKYELRLDNFEGPLDVLVYLIDKNKMSVYEISIEMIADQYLSFLKEQEELNLEIASEFVVMASTLLLLKSKKLLPNSGDNDESELSEEELLRRILEYKSYKEVTEIFREKIQVFSKRYYKSPDKIELKKQELEQDFCGNDIYRAYKKVVERNENKKNENADNIKKIAISDRFSVSDKVKEILKELFKRERFVFGKVYSLKDRPKEEVVTAFSGILELSRREKISANQKELFGDIVVARKKEIENIAKNLSSFSNKEIDEKIDNHIRGLYD